jgi:hypothetical protein
MAPQRTVRTRKLNNKIPLQVLREDEIESTEYKELLENQFKVETGVEKSEENVSSPIFRHGHVTTTKSCLHYTSLASLILTY